MWHHCKAFLSSWGGILVWVGGWDILTDSRAWPHSGWRCATLCLSGLGMTVLTDTLYTNGGLSASWFSPGFGQGAPKLTLIARTTLGLSGTIMLWAGIFNGINYYTWVDSAQEEEGGWLGQAGGWKYVTKDLVCILFGLAMLGLTDTFWAVAALHPIRPSKGGAMHGPPHPMADHESPGWVHFTTSALCVLSVAGQCAMWMGVWNLLEYYFPSTIWREVAYVLGGLLIFSTTKTYLGRSYIAEAEQYEVRRPLSATLVARALVSILGHFLHMTGVWTLFDSYMWPECPDNRRNLVYVAVGLLGLQVSGTLQSEACISPISVLPRVPEWERAHLASVLHNQVYGMHGVTRHYAHTVPGANAPGSELAGVTGHQSTGHQSMRHGTCPI